MTCAPDNTLIYGGYHSFVVIEPKPENEPNAVKIYPTYSRIICVKCSPNFGSSDKTVAIFSDEGHISLWDVGAGSLKQTQQNPSPIHDKLIGGDFADPDKIIAVYERGLITIWRIGINEVTCIKDIFAPKDQVTCITVNPHISWMAAFGLKNGLVVVLDLRKTGRIMHKFRSHLVQVAGLSWSPSPFNIFEIATVTEQMKQKALQNLKSKENDEKNEESNEKQQGEIAPIKVEIPVKSGPKEESIKLVTNLLDELMLNNIPQISPIRLHDGEISEQIESSNPSNLIVSKPETESLNTPKESLIIPTYVSKSKPNPWVGLKFEDDDDESPKKPSVEMKSNKSSSDNSPRSSRENSPEPITLFSPMDFAEECRILKEQITKNKIDRAKVEQEKDEKVRSTQEIPQPERKILRGRRNIHVANSDENSKQGDGKSKENSGNVKVDAERQKKDNNSLRDKNAEAQPEESAEIKPETSNAKDKSLQLNIDLPQFKKDPLLASISKDGAICIWKVGGNGKLERKFLPQNKNSKRKYDKGDKGYECIFWLSPSILLSSSVGYKVVRWNLLEAKSPVPKLVHHDHNDLIFSIACTKKIYPSSDLTTWDNVEKDFVWTYSRDRYLLKTSLGSDKTVVASYATIGGVVASIISSPIDPCRIAICASYGKIWDLSRPHLKNVVMSKIPLKTGDAFSSMAWHPEKENCLGFGSNRGKIGLFNTNALNQPSVMLPDFFTTEIHKVQWGPSLTNSDKWALYAVAESKLICFNVDKPKDDPILYPFNRNESVSNFSWKPDYTMLAIGSKTGSISLFSKSSVHLVTIYAQSKIISKIIWHPVACTTEDLEISPLHNSFATSCTTSVYIYNVDKIDISEMDQSSDRIEVKQIKTNHTKAIRDLDWSPHSSGYLVTAGEDGLSFVLNTETQEYLATLLDNLSSPFTTVLWSPCHQDFILIGCKNESLQIFNLNDHPALDEVGLNESKRKRIEYISKCKKFQKKDDDVNLPEEKDFQKEVGTKTEKLQTIFPAMLPNIAFSSRLFSLEICRQMTDRLHQEKLEEQNNKKLEENCAQLEQNCEKLEENLQKLQLNCDHNCKLHEKCKDKKSEQNKEQVGTELVMKFFGDKENFLESLSEEHNKHRHHSRHTSAQLMSLWTGDLGDNIRNAISNKCLNPWLINMSAMISPKLCQEATEAYANQLNDLPNSDPLEVSSYYLACHKIEEAINALSTKKFYKEAYALARCRLSQNDTILKTILSEWAKYEEFVGQYEVATQIYIAGEHYEESAKCLMKRQHKTVQDSLKNIGIALDLARQTANKGLIESIEAKLEELKQKETEMGPTRAEVILQHVSENKNENSTEEKKEPTKPNAVLDNKNSEEHGELIEFFKDDFLKKIEELKNQQQGHIVGQNEEVTAEKDEVKIFDGLEGTKNVKSNELD